MLRQALENANDSDADWRSESFFFATRVRAARVYLRELAELCLIETNFLHLFWRLLVASATMLLAAAFCARGSGACEFWSIFFKDQHHRPRFSTPIEYVPAGVVMSKLINSKMFWSAVVLVLGFVFSLQLGMQIRGTPEEARARELDLQIEQVTVQEKHVRASLPSSERPEQQLATLQSDDGNN